MDPRKISMFSCDIARAVSRLEVRLPRTELRSLACTPRTRGAKVRDPNFVS